MAYPKSLEWFLGSEGRGQKLFLGGASSEARLNERSEGGGRLTEGKASEATNSRKLFFMEEK